MFDATFLQSLMVAVSAGVIVVLFELVVKMIIQVLRKYPPRLTWPGWRTIAASILIGSIVLLMAVQILRQYAGPLPQALSNVTSTPSPIAIPATPLPTVTPIPFGDLLAETGFDDQGDGDCNEYDTKRLGYSDSQYYIVAPDAGWISVCHFGTWQPRGSVVVTAAVGAEPNPYGFGVLWGWDGGGLSTSDACGFIVRKARDCVIDENGNLTCSEPTYAYKFLQGVKGEWTSQTGRLPFILDGQPHSVRLTIRPDGIGIGYFDGNFVAAFQFTECKSGPVGLVAYGDDQTRIVFDDLQVYSR